MNSPIDHGSPESSSSGSPPPEEVSPVTGGSSNYILNLTSHINNIGSFQGPSKRRLPQGSSFAAASSSRDLKSRRRERERGDSSRAAGGGGGGGGHIVWEKESGGLGKKELKDDLLDQSLVEHLRKEIGDPFLEIGIKG